MPPGPEEATMPTWAADLRVTVAEIRGETRSLVAQLPEVARAIEELRANTVPMKEHLQLMQRVDTLWDRDLGARSDWEEISKQVPVLWADRTRIRAILAVLVALQGAAAAAASIWAALHH